MVENRCEQSSETSYYDEENQICIYVIFTKLTWFESEIFCKHKSWRLFQPSISKLASLQQKFPLVLSDKFWIGLKNFELRWISNGILFFLKFYIQYNRLLKVTLLNLQTGKRTFLIWKTTVLQF